MESIRQRRISYRIWFYTRRNRTIIALLLEYENEEYEITYGDR